VDNAVKRMPIAVRPVAIEDESGLDMCMQNGPSGSRGPCHGSATRVVDPGSRGVKGR
jgi:hypothetical protein